MMNRPPDESAPLAWRMRPRDFSEFVGQAHLLEPGKYLRRAIEADRVSSLILFGPPGCGKTALAHLIARFSQSQFTELNAVTSGIAQIRQVITKASKEKTRSKKKTLLLIDEIHRFNKVQQSALLPDVERGTITLVGASTQNPFFSIIPALSSRSQIVEMKALPPEALHSLLKRALSDPDCGLGKMKIHLTEAAASHLIAMTEGDARRLLNALEIGATTSPQDANGVIHFDRRVAEASIQKKGLVYENKDDHYDTISAFIKSIRGSDPDALGIAVSAHRAIEAIGMPEGRIPLAEAVIYLATAPKSNAAYLAVNDAMEEIASGRVMEVPQALKDAGYFGAKQLKRGLGYLYPHDFPDHFVAQPYLPEARLFYKPSKQGKEKEIADRLQLWRQKMK